MSESTGRQLGWLKDAALAFVLFIAGIAWFAHAGSVDNETERLHRQLCFECGYLYHVGDEAFRTCPKFVEACGSCYPL